MKKRTNKKKRRKNNFKIRLNPKFVTWSIVLIFVTGLLFFVYDKLTRSVYFKIEEVSSNAPVSDFIKQTLKGKSIFKTDLKKAQRLVRNNYPEYKRILIIKEFPNKIRIDIQKRRPVAQIKFGKFYNIDKEAMVLDNGHLRNKKFLTIECGLKIKPRKGQHLRIPAVIKALILLKKLRVLGFFDRWRIDKINCAHLETISFYLNGVKVIVGDTDYQHTLGVLDKLLSQRFKGNLSSLLYIDLRYKRPYIGYKR